MRKTLTKSQSVKTGLGTYTLLSEAWWEIRWIGVNGRRRKTKLSANEAEVLKFLLRQDELRGGDSVAYPRRPVAPPPPVKKPLPDEPIICRNWKEVDTLLSEYLNHIRLGSGTFRAIYNYAQMLKVCVPPPLDPSMLPPRDEYHSRYLPRI